MIFQRLNRTRHFCLLIATALLLAPQAYAAGPKDLLEMVPDDAWGFAIAKSLNQVDATAARLKDALGLPIQVPVTPKALEQLKLADAGIDMASPVCAIMLNVQKM